MNTQNKTTKELIAWVEVIDTSPTMQIISLDTYKQVIEELRHRIKEVPNKHQEEILLKHQFFNIFKNKNCCIGECLKYVDECKTMCFLMDCY